MSAVTHWGPSGMDPPAAVGESPLLAAMISSLVSEVTAGDIFALAVSENCKSILVLVEHNCI